MTVNIFHGVSFFGSMSIVTLFLTEEMLLVVKEDHLNCTGLEVGILMPRQIKLNLNTNKR